MVAEKTNLTESSDREIVITRVVDFPRELVWDAMTKPEHVVNWWGPNGFTTTIQEMDVRPGGVWNHIMHDPDGANYPNYKVFKEVVPPSRLTFSHGGNKEGGGLEVEAEGIWTFDPVEAGKTLVTIRMIFASAEMRDKVIKEYGAVEGGKQTLARLSEFLKLSGRIEGGKETLARLTEFPGEAAPEFVISRTFDAPRELIWKAWTDPKEMTQWWGPRGFANPVCELDVRVGGAWRIVMRSSEGGDYPCHGFYREIIDQEKLVMTMDVSGHPNEWWDMVLPNRDKTQTPLLAMIQTVTFEKLGGKTKLTVRIRFDSVAIRDSMLKMGMTEGWSQSLDRLAELATKS